jgi:hypothetical protein
LSGSDLTQIQPRYSSIIGRSMDNTAMSAYMKCPALYEKSYRQHRRGRGRPTPALNYGSNWHNIMQASYSAPMMERPALEQRVEDYAIERWGLSSDPSDYRTFDRSIVEYSNYLDYYGLPWLETEGRTVGWPDRPLVELAVELAIPGARHPYTGKLDRIFTAHDQYLIEDHKTASQFRSDAFRQWELDSQMIGYDTLGGLLINKPIAGVRINLHVIRKSDSVFERRTILFSPDRVRDWTAKYDEWLERLERDYERAAAGDPLAFPENFAACSGKYGMCQYAGVCSLDSRHRQAALEQDFDIAPWNPLEADGVEADA